MSISLRIDWINDKAALLKAIRLDLMLKIAQADMEIFKIERVVKDLKIREALADLKRLSGRKQ